jgi:hypothetical protein
MLIVWNADPNHYPELADAIVNSSRVTAVDKWGSTAISYCILAGFWVFAGRFQYWKELLGKEAYVLVIRYKLDI